MIKIANTVCFYFDSLAESGASRLFKLCGNFDNSECN